MRWDNAITFLLRALKDAVYAKITLDFLSILFRINLFCYFIYSETNCVLSFITGFDYCLYKQEQVAYSNISDGRVRY